MSNRLEHDENLRVSARSRTGVDKTMSINRSLWLATLLAISVFPCLQLFAKGGSGGSSAGVGAGGVSAGVGVGQGGVSAGVSAGASTGAGGVRWLGHTRRRIDRLRQAQR